MKPQHPASARPPDYPPAPDPTARIQVLLRQFADSNPEVSAAAARLLLALGAGHDPCHRTAIRNSLEDLLSGGNGELQARTQRLLAALAALPAPASAPANLRGEIPAEPRDC